MPGWSSFVAIGDSFTEGLNDPGPDGQFRGWADRLAGYLAAANPGLRYANLAIRGKYLKQIISEQVPLALAAQPDLLSFCAGGNDLLKPNGDPDTVAAAFDAEVARFRAAGADVVICTGFDTRNTPVLKHVRARIATYNGHLWSIADRHGAHVVDLWAMAELHDPQAWSEDRLHLTSGGHLRVARRAAEVLGVPSDGDWREPWPAVAGADWLDKRRADVKWAKEYFLPWIGRHMRGRSSGDGMEPKRPDLTPVA